MPSVSLVQQAEHVLKQWLDAEKLKPGDRLPSERELTRRLGMKHYALNRAMARLITAGLVERQGYTLFWRGGGKPADSFTCDLVVARYSVHLPGYIKVAREAGVALTVHRWTSLEEMLFILRRLSDRAGDAVLIDPPAGFPVSAWLPDAQNLMARGLAVVCVGQSAPGISSIVKNHSRALDSAVEHLRSCGHRELGLLTDEPLTPVGIEVTESWGWICRKYGGTSSIKRIHYHDSARHLREEASTVADLLTKDWSRATALVVFSSVDYPVQHLLDELASRGKTVPGDLSLIFRGGQRGLLMTTPPMSVVTFDNAIVQETAFYLARRTARKLSGTGAPPSPVCMRVDPFLQLRGSILTRTPPSPVKPTDSAAAPDASSSNFAPRPYPMAATADTSRFTKVNLSPFMNRPLHYRRGWLGDLPLKNFPPGEHVIHAVPFDVQGGPKRSDCGAIVFRSMVNTQGSLRELPVSLRIPLQCKIRAAYFLHGCGYAKHLHPFATYTFYNGKKIVAAIPLVSLGAPLPDVPRRQTSKREKPPEANIQDWWPDFPHQDFPGARRVPVQSHDETDSPQPSVFLYTLQWINPSPSTPVSHLDITVDPTQSTTLGLLGLTLLHP